MEKQELSPIEVMRSNRKPETKLVLGYVLASPPCLDATQEIAAALKIEVAHATAAIESLLRMGVISASSVNGQRCLGITQRGPDATIQKILTILGSPIKPSQIKGADRAALHAQASVLADTALMEQVIINLPSWLRRAPKMWPWRDEPGRKIGLTDVLRNLQDIALYTPPPMRARARYAEPALRNA